MEQSSKEDEEKEAVTYGEHKKSSDFIHPKEQREERGVQAFQEDVEKCLREVSGELISQWHDEKGAENGEHEETNDFVHPNKQGSDFSGKSSIESKESSQASDESDHNHDESSNQSNIESSSYNSDQSDGWSSDGWSSDDWSSNQSNESSSYNSDQSDGWSSDGWSSDDWSSNQSNESSSYNSDQSSETSAESTSLGSFKQVYHCYPLSKIEKSLPENGDKIIMPTSALMRLLHLEIQYPMQFQIQNESSGRVSHCGVLEFTGKENSVFLPNWMMENMQLQERNLVIVKNASLDRGTYMKLQPHTTDFIHVSNMKDLLEDILRNFSCLTVGDTITINHNSKKFYINILETKPSAAINIIDTDCEVEFAPPLDYKEPEKPAPKNAATVEDQEKQAKEKGKFVPFQGLARRENSAVPELSSELKEQALDAADAMATQPNVSPRRRDGKLVFGSRKKYKLTD